MKLTIDGFIDKHQAGKIKVIKHHYEDISARKKDLEGFRLSAPHQTYIDPIFSMPSEKDVFTAITIISEIGVGISHFPTSKHLCPWAGLPPTNNESLGRKNRKEFLKPVVTLNPFWSNVLTLLSKAKKTRVQKSLSKNQT